MPAAQLPAPGPQPADPTADRAAAVASFLAAKDPSTTDADRGAHVQGGADLVARTRAALAAAYPAQVSASSVDVRDSVFTAPDDISLRYDILLSGNPVLTDRFAELRLVDGRWVLTTESFCRDVRVGGVACPG